MVGAIESALILSAITATCGVMQSGLMKTSRTIRVSGRTLTNRRIRVLTFAHYGGKKWSIWGVFLPRGYDLYLKRVRSVIAVLAGNERHAASLA